MYSPLITISPLSLCVCSCEDQINTNRPSCAVRHGLPMRNWQDETYEGVILSKQISICGYLFEAKRRLLRQVTSCRGPFFFLKILIEPMTFYGRRGHPGITQYNKHRDRASSTQTTYNSFSNSCNGRYGWTREPSFPESDARFSAWLISLVVSLEPFKLLK